MSKGPWIPGSRHRLDQCLSENPVFISEQSEQICFRSGIHEPVGRIWSENFRFLFALVRSDPTNDRLRCVDFYSSQFRKNGQDNLSPFDPLKSHLFFAFMANQCIFPSVLKSKGTKDYRTSDDLRRDDLEGHEI